MNKKLSKEMQFALKHMEIDNQYSARDLDVSLRTLFALYERKLVDYKVYDSWSPRIGIDWQITEAGQAVKENFE